MTGSKRTHRQEKLARLYDDEILPVWSQRFARMMLRHLEVPPKATVLDVASATGYLALEILRRMDGEGRLVAIDPSGFLLDVARAKAGDLAGKRIFFRRQSAWPKLPFTGEVFDLVVDNLGLIEAPEPRTVLRELWRVTKPGGQVLATIPLAGTWGEFLDLYREVLVKRDKPAMLARLDSYAASLPDPTMAESWMVSAGLVDVRLEVEDFSLLFRSSREFFFAPVVEHGPLARWKEVAGRGAELQEVFSHIKEAIDRYFGGRAFEVSVRAGCLRGRRGTGLVDDGPTGQMEPAGPGSADDPIPLGTAELELVDDGVDGESIDDDEGIDALRRGEGDDA